MINVDEHFEQGGAGYLMASQAVEHINAARSAGLTDQANKIESGLMDSIMRLKASKGRDLNGFRAYVKEASSLEPETKKIVTKQNEVSNAGASIDASISLMGSSGAKINPETIKQIELAKQSGNVAGLKSLAESFGKTSQNLFEQSVKPMSAEEAVKIKKGEATDKSVALNFYQHIGDLADSEEKMGRIFGTQFGLTGGESTYSRPVTKSALSDLQSVKGSARQIGVSFLKGQGSVSDAEGAAAAASVVGIEAGEDLDQAHFKLRRLQAFMRDKWDNGYYNKWNIANGLPEIGVGVEGGFMPASATKSEASLLKPKEAKEDKESDPYAEAVRSINSIPSAPK
tara:strand:+ start:210 stop:1235 length:1026 start_codon:yes stop_codon:yes gene_type:complete